MTQPQKQIVIRELKSIKEIVDLMVYAMGNDKEFPTSEDIEHAVSMGYSVLLIKINLTP